jgi:hypothetical protein
MFKEMFFVIKTDPLITRILFLYLSLKMARSNPVQFSIPDPCTMKWEEMERVDEHSRNCSSCERVIVDFTKMSDAELVSFFNKNKHACGKFTTSQLNRELKIDRTIARNGAWKNIFMLPALFLGLETFAREKSGENENKTVSSYIKNTTEHKAEQPQANATNDSLVIQGHVTDAATGEPVLFAIVSIRDSLNGIVSGTTDVNGAFSLKIANPEQSSSVNIVVTNVGYLQATRKVDLNGSPINIALELAEVHMVGIVITDNTPRSKTRRFFYKLFHPRSW